MDWVWWLEYRGKNFEVERWSETTIHQIQEEVRRAILAVQSSSGRGGRSAARTVNGMDPALPPYGPPVLHQDVAMLTMEARRALRCLPRFGAMRFQRADQLFGLLTAAGFLIVESRGMKSPFLLDEPHCC